MVLTNKEDAMFKRVRNCSLEVFEEKIKEMNKNMDKKCKNHDSLTIFTQKYNQEMKRLIDVHANLASEIKKKLEKEDYQ